MRIVLVTLLVALTGSLLAGSVARPVPANLTAVPIGTPTKAPCPKPGGNCRWRIDPCNMQALANGNLGILVQKVTLDHKACSSCSVQDIPELGKFVLLGGCVDTLHEHYEYKFLTNRPLSRIDILVTNGEPAAHTSKVTAECKFVHHSSPQFMALYNHVLDPDKVSNAVPYEKPDGTTIYIAPVNGELPYGWPGVDIGRKTGWSHDPPPGWDTDFNMTAETGGDHELQLNWICCPPDLCSVDVICQP